MSMSVFISHVHEDSPHIQQLKAWNTQGLLGPGLTFTTEVRDLRPQGADAIDAHLRPRIRGAGAVLVLIGSDTHNHDWVRREIELAQSLGKRLVLTRLPGTSGAAPVNARYLPVVHWAPGALRDALTR